MASAARIATRLAAVLLVAVAAAVAIPLAAEEMTFERSSAAIVTDRGKFDFTVEMALTPAQHAQGLQHREYLPPSAGMLFDFHEDRVATMWMKNTSISLDMIFIDAGGTIVSIAQETQPFSLRTVSSGAPVRAVLEVTGGTARRIGAKAGDRVLHPMFGAS